MTKPSLGRIVHYVDESGTEHAAIITHVWTDATINLYSFPADNAQQGGAVLSVPLSKIWDLPASWHWPERVEGD